MKTHHDLDAWQLGIKLAEEVYEKTRGFPREEAYGLVSQMRRAAVSVPTNIAEGAGRETTKDYRRFLIIARGSLGELETLIFIASNVGMLSANDREALLNHRKKTARTLQGLIRSLKI